MRRDLAAVLEVDCIAVLPGWRTSCNAILEVLVAVTIGLPVYEADVLVRGRKVALKCSKADLAADMAVAYSARERNGQEVEHG